MSYAIIATKVDPQTKKEAMQMANALGMPLSVVIKAMLKQFIRTKRLTVTLHEEPSAYLQSIIEQAEDHIKKGKHSPVFKTGTEAVKWLEKRGL